MSSVKGLDSFFDVLAVIKNPAVYEQKLKELETQTNKYKEVVEAVVELSKVNDYTVSIREREEKSKQVLADAETKAAEITANALTKANSILDEKRNELQKAKDKAKKVEEMIKANEDWAISLNAKAHQLQIAEQHLIQKENELLDKLKEVDERLSKLKAVMQ